jgi:hypothetical protein
MAKLSRKQIKEGLDQIPIEVIFSAKESEPKLTYKEKQFVKGVVEGKPKAQAYREAYNTKSTKQRQASDAVKLSKKPKISQAIDREEVRKKFVELRNSSQWREHILQGLLKESLDENSPPTARIQALALLGKVAEISLFEDRKTTTIIHKKSSDIEKELIEQLSSVIDVQAKETEDTLLAELSGNKPTLLPVSGNKPTLLPLTHVLENGMSGGNVTTLDQELGVIPYVNEGGQEDTPPPPSIDPSDSQAIVHTILHNQSEENNNDK